MLISFSQEQVKIQLLLYIVQQQNLKKIFKKKKKTEQNVTRKKQFRAYKGYASTYNVDLLNCFNPELQLKILKILNLQLEINPQI